MNGYVIIILVCVNNWYLVIISVLIDWDGCWLNLRSRYVDGEYKFCVISWVDRIVCVYGLIDSYCIRIVCMIGC